MLQKLIVNVFEEVMDVYVHIHTHLHIYINPRYLLNKRCNFERIWKENPAAQSTRACTKCPNLKICLLGGFQSPVVCEASNKSG